MAISRGCCRLLLWGGSRPEARITAPLSCICDGTQPLPCLVAPSGGCWFSQRGGKSRRVEESSVSGKGESSDPKLAQWSSGTMVGAGDRGWAVWTRARRTSGSSHNRSSNPPGSHDLVPGDEPAHLCPKAWDAPLIVSSHSGRSDQALWAASVGRAKLQASQTCPGLGTVSSEKRSSHPTALAVRLLLIFVLLVSRLSPLLQDAQRDAGGVC